VEKELEGLIGVAKAFDNAVFVDIKPEGRSWVTSMLYQFRVADAFEAGPFSEVRLWLVFEDGRMRFLVENTYMAE